MPGYVGPEDGGSLRKLTGGILYDYMVGRRFLDEGSRVEFFDLESLPRHAKLLKFLSASRLGRASGEFDVLISDLGNSTLTMGFQDRARRNGKLTVLICHHFRSGLERSLLKRLLYRFSEAGVVSGAHLLVANSTHTAGILRSMGRSDGDIVLAPPGLGVPVASEPVSREAPREILSVCGIEPRKGVLEMVRALGASGLAHLSLTVAGDREQDTAYTGRVMELIGELGLSQRVRLPGRMTREELVDAYRRADVFMLLSNWEGYGMAIAEAMASGLPVISTTAGAIPALVEDGETGILVEPGDWRSAAAGIQRLFTDGPLRHRLSSGALRRASGFPTWDETTGRVVGAVRQRLGEATGLH